ncbi:MAG TPA: hypothetical protein VNE86_04205 [Nitrososphaerales archaeon]|nr:hypothetical protein [Nitrososphaerales archaeon]
MSESLPKWVAEEIKDVKFGKEEDWEGSGYILDINKEAKKIDVQFYEKLPEGRYIATLELPEKFDADSLELGKVYMFKFKAFKATLSDKVTEFLKEKFNVVMDAIFRFELASVERLETEADSAPARPSEDDDDDD